MDPNKSLGTDRFNPGFYQTIWQLVEDVVFRSCSRWLEEGQLPDTMQSTHIVLIPKVESPSNMKELRSISLCNVLYRMVEALLASHTSFLLTTVSFFCRGDISEAQELKQILGAYERASGHAINLSKSGIYCSNNTHTMLKKAM
ncbi:hypothetical protein LINPERPRIM_LOCUS20235 [Linum perenne]